MVAELEVVVLLFWAALTLSFVFVLCRWNECRFSAGDDGEFTVGDVGEAGEGSSLVFFFSNKAVNTPLPSTTAHAVKRTQEVPYGWHLGGGGMPSPLF